MSKKTPAPGHGEFNWKPGMNAHAGWRGMALDGDASAISPDQLRLIVNARRKAGEYVPRWGWTKQNATALHSSAAKHQPWAFNFNVPYRLWIVGTGLPGCSATGGSYVAHYDHEQSPIFSRAVYYDKSVSTPVLGTFDGQMHVGTDDLLRLLRILRVPYGTEPLALSGRGSDTFIHKFTGFTIRALRVQSGVLLIGLDAGSGASKIALWDGVTMYDGTQGTTADVASIDAPTAFGTWRDKLVVGFSSATNAIHLRDPGSTTPGTYTSVAPGAGTVASVDMVEHLGNLYIADGDENVWVYNGSTLSIARTVTGADITAVASYNRFLYYGYDLSNEAIVGRYDGTNWVDEHKNLTDQFTNARTVESMARFRRQLYVAGNRDSGGGRVWVSPELSTSGTYTEIVPNASNNGTIQKLVAA